MAELGKGANVALSREIPGLTGVVLGVRWDAGGERPLADNLGLGVILCGSNGKSLSGEHFVFSNQMVSPERSTAWLEDALDGDDEQIEVDLARVPDEVSRIVLLLHIGQGGPWRRSLGQVRSIRARVLDAANHAQIATSQDLAPGLGQETALIIGELYRHQGGWKFKVVGQGYSSGLAGAAKDYGVPL